MNALDDDERIWVLDTELNGRVPGEIIELAAVEMIGTVLTGRYRQWRFRPVESVDRHATRIHGITDADLRYCPRIADCAEEIRRMLAGHAIAGHAVNVEVDALQRVLPGWEPPRAYDTLRMSRRAHPDIARHRLSAMGEHLGLDAMATRLTSGMKAHSAFYDALLCGLIMRHMLEPLDPQGRRAMLRHCDIMTTRREKARREALRAAKAELRRRMRGA